MRLVSRKETSLPNAWIAAVSLLVAFGAAYAPAPAAEAPQTLEELTTDLLEKRIAQVRELQELDDATKSRVVELYQQARQELERADEWAGRAARFRSDLAGVPRRLRQTEEALATLPTQLRVDPPETVGLPELERQLAHRERQLNDPDEGLRARSLELEAEPARRQNRRREIPAEIRSAQERLSAADERLQAPPPADDPSEVASARWTLWQARKRAAESEIDALRQELALYEAEEAVNLLRLRRDFLARQTALAEQEISQLREVVDRRRREEAEERLRQARLEAAGADPLLRPLAGRIEELARQQELVTHHRQEAEIQLRESNRRFDELQAQLRRAREMVESVGLTDAVGLLLRSHRVQLPDPHRLRRRMDARRQVIREVQFQLFDLDEERSALADVEPRIRQILVRVDPRADEVVRRDLERAAREMMESKQEQLDRLIGSYNSYFMTLVDLDNAQSQLIEQSREYADFIDERVFWIRGSPVLDHSAVDPARDAAQWLIGKQEWNEAVLSLFADAQSNPVPLLAAVCVLGMLIYYRRRIRIGLRQAGAAAERSTSREFLPTIEALLYTVFMAVPLPAVIWYAGWRLAAVPEPGDFTRALAPALTLTATIYFPLELVRWACAPKGLIDAHFGWSASAVRLLRKHLGWLKLVALPLALVGATLQAQDIQVWQDSLGRLCFVLGLIAVAVFLQRALRPPERAWQGALASRRGTSLERSKIAWSLPAVLIPLALAALAVWGYYYTAQKLAWRLQLTVWLLAALWFGHALLLRWVLIKKRKFAIEEARERRATVGEKASHAGEALETSVIPSIQAPSVDWASIGEQTRRLLRSCLAVIVVVGLWLIWGDILPALRLLDLPLWAIEDEDFVTLGNVGLTVLIGVFAFVAARNIPGLLEIAILQRLPFDSGLRYAITTLVSYAIVFFGIVFGFGALGIGWNKVQWLVAAVTVGLGFGLQEIFANFVSGVILLFERPIRVGDVISIDGVDGRVTDIRMRATTIMNWERKELIVPNKDLITGRLLNWTLTTEMLRVPIAVGVAYGSDTDQVRELLDQIALDHPDVLDNPAPFSTFEEFGDSSLHFVLRIFLPNLDNLWTVLHDLHSSIHKRFADAGIEIAFPQRDLHVRSVPESIPVQPASSFDGDGAQKAPANERHSDVQK